MTTFNYYLWSPLPRYAWNCAVTKYEVIWKGNWDHGNINIQKNILLFMKFFVLPSRTRSTSFKLVRTPYGIQDCGIQAGRVTNIFMCRRWVSWSYAGLIEARTPLMRLMSISSNLTWDREFIVSLVKGGH